MSGDVREITRKYVDAWKAKDFATLRSLLADDVTFSGPMGDADGAQQCIAGMEMMARTMTDIVTRKVFVDGADVLTWYDLHTTIAPPSPVANWSHVEGGLIDRILATFDAPHDPRER